MYLFRLVTHRPRGTQDGTMIPQASCPAGTCPPRPLVAAAAAASAASAVQTGGPDNPPPGGINMKGIDSGRYEWIGQA